MSDAEAGCETHGFGAHEVSVALLGVTFEAQQCDGAVVGQLDDATDCAGYVERAGGTVAVVQGDPALLKVTDGDDLAAVERLLQGAAP